MIASNYKKGAHGAAMMKPITELHNNNSDLNTLFSSRGKDDFYNKITDELLPWSKEAKTYWRDLYSKYQHFLDQNFPNELAIDSFSRLWELTLVDFLDRHSNQGVNLRTVNRQTSAPDFCFNLQDNCFYLEAVCASPGNIPALNVSLADVHGIARETPRTEHKERLSSVIHEKAYNKYYGTKNNGYKSSMEENSGLIIAVSMSKIDFFNQANHLQVDLSCLFGMSPMKIPLIPIDNYRRVMGSPYHDYQASYEKKSNKKGNEAGALIKSNYFANEQYSHISAILLSHNGCSFFPDVDKFLCGISWKECRNDFKLIHNPFAKTPLPIGLLNVSHEIPATIGSDGSINVPY